MKIFNYLFLAGALLATASCENDMEKLTYQSGEAKAAVLDTPAQTSLILESRNSENVALDLTWSKPDFGYQAIVTNNVELDLAANNFSNPRIIASGSSTTTTHSVTVADLNSTLISLLADNGIEEDFSARDYQVRIASSISADAETLYSNVLTLNITPYSMDIQYPEIYVIGSYNSWAQDDSQQSLFSFSEDEVNFEGIIDFGSAAANGFKIKGAIDNWDNGNWGLDGSATAPGAEAASIQLINDGSSSDIKCYSKRFYRFQFNNSTMVLTNDLSFDALYLVGSAQGLTWDTSKPENQMNFDPETQRFYIDFALNEGDEIKVLTDTQVWFGGTADGGLNTQDNIKVPATGNYRVYVNMNNSKNMTYELNAEDYGAE